MSCRTLLTSFFVLIVVVPMVAVGILVLRLIDVSVEGKANPSVAGLVIDAASVYASESAVARARRNRLGAESIAAEQSLARRARAGGRETGGLLRERRQVLADVGNRDATAEDICPPSDAPVRSHRTS